MYSSCVLFLCTLCVNTGNDGGHSGNVLYANQWDNLANRQAHIDSTAPEIWEALEGDIDAFSCACGTGGTLAGTGAFFQVRKSVVDRC